MLLGVLILLTQSGCFNLLHRMPRGTSFEGLARPVEEVSFLTDTTWVDAEGVRQVDQHIFDAVMDVIDRAEHFIILDMFLWNDFQGEPPETTRALSSELTEALIKRKIERPEMTIVAISDPVNTVYGSVESAYFKALRTAGIPVVLTRLDRLRDSNPSYSSFWRVAIKPFGQSRGGLLPSPFSQERVNTLSYLALLNFKANHRKVIVADRGGEARSAVAIVTSANPHDGSSAHSNIGVRFTGAAALDVLETELAVIEFSGGEIPEHLPRAATEIGESASPATIRVITEGKIHRSLRSALARANESDEIDVSVFYLSDRRIVEDLIDARGRGARVRVLLDPNKDAFGHEKNGVPNRPVAVDLRRGDIEVRWCNTHGEQCHAKMLLVRYADGYSMLIAGSANFTRRNLQDLNLETNIELHGPDSTAAIRESSDWFEMLWSNRGGREYTAEYEVFEDESLRKHFQYHIQEKTGLSTF